MDRNITCDGICVKNSQCTDEWCEKWKPPPFPVHISEKIQKGLETSMKNDPAFKIYSNYCSFPLPDIRTSTTKATSTTTGSVTTALSPSLTSTTDTAITEIPLIQEEAHTAGGTIAVIVIVPLVILIVLLCLCYLWKQKKKRSASINSLPLKRYADTNYLDNKARDNHSWNQSSNHQPNETGNHYGSMPRGDFEKESNHIKTDNRKSSELRVESPREFDKMNRSGLSDENFSFDNKNFENDKDPNGGISPGTNSLTPLFDCIDGPALPNAVLNNKTASENSIEKTDTNQKNGSLGKLHNGKSPPVDMAVTKRSTTDSSKKSPKKKKPLYLQRQSEPVTGIEDITQDMAGNRKSV